MKALTLSVLALSLLSCTPQVDDCPVYHDDATYEDVEAACVDAFGDGYCVVMRTCPRGLVPNGCASLTEHDGTVVTCPDYAEPLDVLGCWE